MGIWAILIAGSSVVGCVIRVPYQDRSWDATSCLVGERSAQVDVAENFFGQGHNGGKAVFRGGQGRARDDVE